MSHVPTMLKSDRSVCDMHATYLKIMVMSFSCVFSKAQKYTIERIKNANPISLLKLQIFYNKSTMFKIVLMLVNIMIVIVSIHVY